MMAAPSHRRVAVSYRVSVGRILHVQLDMSSVLRGAAVPHVLSGQSTTRARLALHCSPASSAVLRLAMMRNLRVAPPPALQPPALCQAPGQMNTVGARPTWTSIQVCTLAAASGTWHVETSTQRQRCGAARTYLQPHATRSRATSARRRALGRPSAPIGPAMARAMRTTRAPAVASPATRSHATPARRCGRTPPPFSALQNAREDLTYL